MQNTSFALEKKKWGATVMNYYYKKSHVVIIMLHLASHFKFLCQHARYLARLVYFTVRRIYIGLYIVGLLYRYFSLLIIKFLLNKTIHIQRANDTISPV